MKPVLQKVILWWTSLQLDVSERSCWQQAESGRPSPSASTHFLGILNGQRKGSGEGPWPSMLFAYLQWQFQTPICARILARLGMFVYNKGVYTAQVITVWERWRNGCCLVSLLKVLLVAKPSYTRQTCVHTLYLSILTSQHASWFDVF